MWGSFAEISLPCVSAAVRAYTTRISIWVQILDLCIDIKMWGSFADISLYCVQVCAAVRRYTLRISIFLSVI